MKYRTALVQLPLVCEQAGKPVLTPSDAAALCADIADLAQETFHVLLLNNRNRLIERQMVTLGVVDSTFMHAREIFRPAILAGANQIVLTHNHPSGDPSPSAEDIKSTRQMIEAGRIIGIKVLDHVIVGKTDGTHAGYQSLRETGACPFE